MSIITHVCPHCSNSVQLPSNLVGKQGKCPGCGSVVTISATILSPRTAPPQQPQQQQPLPQQPQQYPPQQQPPQQQQYPQQQPLQQQPLQQQPLQQARRQRSKKKPLTKNLMLVGIILIPFIAIALVLSFYVDKQNNDRAEIASAAFAKKQHEMEIVFTAFEEGTLGSAATAIKMRKILVMIDEFDEQHLKRERSTGWYGIFFWGTDNDLLDADSMAAGQLQVDIREMAPKIVAAARVVGIAAMIKGDGSVETGMAAFEDALGGAETLEIIANLVGMEGDTLRRKF